MAPGTRPKSKNLHRRNCAILSKTWHCHFFLDAKVRREMLRLSHDSLRPSLPWLPRRSPTLSGCSCWSWGLVGLIPTGLLSSRRWDLGGRLGPRPLVPILPFFELHLPTSYSASKHGNKDLAPCGTWSHPTVNTCSLTFPITTESSSLLKLDSIISTGFLRSPPKHTIFVRILVQGLLLGKLKLRHLVGACVNSNKAGPVSRWMK